MVISEVVDVLLKSSIKNSDVFINQFYYVTETEKCNIRSGDISTYDGNVYLSVKVYFIDNELPEHIFFLREDEITCMLSPDDDEEITMNFSYDEDGSTVFQYSTLYDMSMFDDNAFKSLKKLREEFEYHLKRS